MLTAAEREAVQVILRTAQQGEWQKGVCSRCSYAQIRGHKCSCPVKRAYKLLARVVGKPEQGLEDDDLIVHAAMAKLAPVTTIPPVDVLAIVWAAVDAALQLGARR